MTSACICRASKDCKSLVLQDKCNIEMFLSPAMESEHFHGNCFICLNLIIMSCNIKSNDNRTEMIEEKPT